MSRLNEAKAETETKYGVDMAINIEDFNEVECELVQSGYNSLDISSIWKDKKLLKKIISDIEESRNLSIEELEKRLGIC